MLHIVYYLIIIVNIVYLLYFIASLKGFFRKKSSKKMNSKNNFFGILVAASNEETVIGNLIDSLNDQNYPKDKYEVFILVNNCQDNTKKISFKKGATVIEIDAVKNKGEVLNKAFKQLKNNKKIDGYIIFDADNVVNRNFLSEMNKELENGSLVAQGFRDSKNINYNWLSIGYSIFYYIQNLFFKARNNNDLSSVINGTGFMIKKNIIDGIGYDMKTFTEDMEFSALCTLGNIKIDFVESAITYDEQPIKFKTSWKQRRRWSTGCYQCLKEYGLKLLKKGIKTQDISALDLFFIFFSPFLQVITTITFFFNIIYVVLRYGLFLSSINGLIIGLLGYLSMVLLSILVLKYNNKDLKELRKGILLFPIFVLSWLPIQFICLFKGVKKWEHIEHTVKTTIEQREY